MSRETDREALRQVAEALERLEVAATRGGGAQIVEAVDAARAALALPAVRAAMEGTTRATMGVTGYVVVDKTQQPPDALALARARLQSIVSGAHYVDIIVRRNGKDEHHQADWLKDLAAALPPDLLTNGGVA